MAILLQIPTVLLMPLLPEKYRKIWPWELEIPQQAVCYLTALLHVVLAFFAWGFAYTSYQKAFGDMIAAAVADPNGTGEIGAITWLGVFGFFAFFFTLKGMLVWTYLIDAVLRFIKAATVTEFSGSIFLWAPLALFDLATSGMKKARMVKVYGPADEPDRVLEIEGGLLVRSNRPHPEWHGLLAFHFKAALYRLESGLEGFDGTRKCFEYHFSPWPDSEMVRHIVVLGNREEAL